MEEMKKLTMNEFLEKIKQKGYNTFTRMPCGCDRANGEIYDMTREIDRMQIITDTNLKEDEIICAYPDAPELLKCPTLQCPGMMKPAVILEDGMCFNINHCAKCGYWCGA